MSTARDIRVEALRMALQLVEGRASTAGIVVDAAKQFETFLTGQTAPAEAGECVRGGGDFSAPANFATVDWDAAASERLTEGTKAVLRSASREALQLGQNVVTPEHLLLGILREADTAAAATLIGMAGTGKAARRAVIDRIIHPVPSR